jgi:hypothetical protein
MIQAMLLLIIRAVAPRRVHPRVEGRRATGGSQDSNEAIPVGLHASPGIAHRHTPVREAIEKRAHLTPSSLGNCDRACPPLSTKVSWMGLMGEETNSGWVA